MQQPAVRVASAAAALFASDMHLDEAAPELTGRFLQALDEALAASLGREARAAAAHDRGPDAAVGAPALFLLGDLFEYWIGDDHLCAPAQALATRLDGFVRAGGRVFLMHGNRDFLVDAPLPSPVPAFSARCSARLLPDPCLIEVAGRRIALSHGDLLCTDDVRYQQWRALSRSRAWQAEFLARPVAQRLAMALSLRQQSVEAQAVTETLSDVNQAAVDRLMDRMDTSLLIHGHTHRPQVHHWHLPAGACSGANSGSPPRARHRWVLSDWAVSPPRGAVVPLAAIAPVC